ncbi:S-layer homology domain-containing protein [Anaerosphaera multitolerans]|uniref:Isopeptide-forming domain-containing fimbrial protein n=1 Tax=Anaerosphaera multitolerans TaxID=2487351 RepID=A0A437S6I1_9FIRM|nr:S-layer homology domain-containing protein [Anaerosphaera multitolerans]RVU54616.1 isopeptide-forming domain-containing fimbrial protein [Anaerosphaera multitolerans]
MRKIINSVLIFSLILNLFTVNVFAKEDIQVVFEQPAVYSASKGDVLNYKLNIKLPDDYMKDYKSFAVTILMDSNLEVTEQKLAGAELVQGKVDLTLTNVKKNTQNLVTLSVNDTEALKGVKEFSVVIKTKVKEDAKGQDALKNSFVLTYVDRAGNENSGQTNLESNTKAQDGNLTVYEVYNNSTVVSGKTEPNSKVKVLLNDKVLGEATSDKDGNFKVTISKQEIGTKLDVVSYFKKDGEDKTASNLVVVKDVKNSYITESLIDENMSTTVTEDMEVLDDYYEMAKSMDISAVKKEDAARLTAALANAQYIKVKSDVIQSEVSDAVDKLSEGISEIRVPIMNGRSKDTFGPKESMKRSEVASVLAKIYAGENITGVYSSFKDVKQEAWYADAVGYMEKNGFISGYKNGEFRPENPITRTEFASILVKVADLEKKSKATTFKDVNSNFWGKEAIDIVTSNGLMNGRSEGKFVPNEPINRAEVATVLNKLLNRTPNKEFIGKYSKNPFKDVSKTFWAYYEIMEVTGN